MSAPPAAGPGAPSSAREVVLSRLRSALADVPATEQVADVAVARDYRSERPMPRGDLLDLFAERVADYRAQVHRTDAAGAPAAVAAVLRAYEVRRVVVPADVPGEWLSAAEGVEPLTDDPASPLAVTDLDGADGVLVGCAVGIGETGTIVLDAGARQGRRALTLVPDLLVCVVHGDQVVATVPEALARLDGTRPLTFISGPSATSDIELSRVEGVHGPRTLEVLLVDG